MEDDLTPPEPPAARERRATDGLDWRTSLRPPEAPEPAVIAPTAEPAEPPFQVVPPPVPEPAGRPRRFVPKVRFPRIRVPRVASHALAALAGGLVAGIIVAVAVGGRDNPAPPAAAGPKTALTVEETSAIVQAAAKARPSVVRIEGQVRTQAGVGTDVGSGVVLDTEGHVLTNAHVVQGASTLKVILADGTSRAAVVIGDDFPFTDLAVLQVPPGNLTPIDIGDSSALKLGESVLAIGNPLAEFDGSVTVGVVSGTNRSRNFDAVRQDDLIQTDAAINNGNSGGALLNLAGQFVGMPTAILRDAPGQDTAPVEGIAFVLPANRLMTVARKIITDGASYPRPSLGVTDTDLSPDVRTARTTLTDGALVQQVARGGPAEAAGILPGDVITKIGDHDVNQDNPMLNALAAYNPGDTVKVVLNRSGRIIEVEVRLAKKT